ncbi:MAG: chorismate mutase [bacterium]|jgi:chorismate mutase|nr:chorismate mutase [bacterium]
MIRGVRGAITTDANTEEAIIEAAMEILSAMISANGLHEDDVASIFFTTTPDLTTAYPARGARRLGWTKTALMGGVEMDVVGSIPRCIRVLIHWNTDKPLDEIKHIYLRDAVKLRPDWSANT